MQGPADISPLESLMADRRTDWTRRGLLGAAAATLVGITVASKNSSAVDDVLSSEFLNTVSARPPQPSASATQLVPVRTAAAVSSSPVLGTQVALRQLIIATDSGDFELSAWTSILDQ